MKLGKLDFKSLLAIIESILFTLGALCFLLVIIIPTNPIWALVAGIVCGLAGAIVWSYPLFVRLAKIAAKKTKQIKDAVKTNIENNKVNAEDVAKKILEDDDLQKHGYELHRANEYEYDSIADNIVDDVKAEPKVEEPNVNDKPAE